MSRFTVSNAQQGGQAPAVEPQAWTPEQIARWQQQQAQLQAQQQQLADPYVPPSAFAQPGPAQAPAWRQPQADGQAYAPPYTVPPSPHGAQGQAAAFPAPDAWPQHLPHQQPVQHPLPVQWPAQPQQQQPQHLHQPAHYQQSTAYPDPATGQQPGWGAAAAPHASGHGQSHEAQAEPFAGQPHTGAYTPEPQSLAQIIEATRRSVAAGAAQPQGYAADPRTGWPADHRTGEPFAAAALPHGQSASHEAQHTWDLANYPPASDPRQAQFSSMPSGAAGWPDGAAAASQAYGHGAYANPADPRWPGAGIDGHAQPGLEDPYGASRAHPGYADPAGSPTADGQFQYGAPPDTEPPATRRGPNTLIVGSALVGAIVLGGGLAWGYKKMTGGSAAPVVVKADKTPAKARPDQPGGKDMPHTDKKIFKQLGESSPPPQPPAKSPAAPPQAETQPPDGAPRRVTTLVVRPDGTLAPQSVQPSAPPAASTGVPGMVIDPGPRPPPRPPAAEGAPQLPPMPAAAAPPRPAEPPMQPQRLNEPPPRVAEPPRARAPEPPARPERTDRSERPEAVAKAEPPPKTPAVKKKAPPRDDAAAPSSGAGSTASGAAAGATTTARVTTSSGGGFVTVLASRKTQDEAFRMFPDLQTKYAEILSGKVPDVRETDLTKQGKGVVFRLVVGPPGSKESAIETCSKLKAQGFTGCWATPY